MSEEEKVEEPVEETQASDQPEEASDNVIFNALYAAAEEGKSEEEQEQPEVYTGPASIHSALAEEPEPEQVEEPSQPEAQESVAQEQPKPKAKVKRKVIDPNFEYPQQPQQRRVVSKPDPFVENLLPEEKEAYNISRWASQYVKGQENLSKQYLDFFKKHKKYLEDNSEYDLADSEEYKKFISENKPKADLKKFEKEMWTSEAETRALKRLQPEISRLRRDQLKIQGEPLAASKKEQAKKILFDSIPDDSKSVIKENGIKGLVESNPIEAQIINNQLTGAQDMADTFYKIVYNVEDYDEKNPKHKLVSDFINREQEKFIKSGRTVKGGKTFVRRERMPLVPKDQVDKYYTFSDDDIINLIALRAKEAMQGKISTTRSSLEKAGYVRNGAPVVKQPTQQVEQPRKIQTPTPSPGVSAPSTQANPQGGNSILKLLDL